MKFKFAIPLFLSALFIYSCGSSTEDNYTINPSKDAQIYSFKIEATHKPEGDSIPRAQDSIRFLALKKINFAIDQVGGTIYNPDPLPYGLKLEKVKMTLGFNATYGVSEIKIENIDSTFVWNTTDSVDFSRKPITFHVTSRAGTQKEYNVNVMIHQTDPNVIVWENKGTLPIAMGEQKVLMANNNFYSYTLLSNSLVLHKSSIGNLSWIEKPISGLPGSTVLNSISYFENKFLAVSKEGSSYVSTDGENWTLQNNGKNVANIYGVIPGVNSTEDVLLVLLKDNGKYYYGTTKDLSSVDIVTKIEGSPSDNSVKNGFPLIDFASATNFNRNRNTNFLILAGGMNNDLPEKPIEYNNVWLISNTSDGLELIPSPSSYFKGGGLSLFLYNDLTYVWAENKLYTSSSWGEKWQASEQIVDPLISKRKYQSIAVDTDKNIWVFGGKPISAPKTYLNDVWKGKLNGVK